MVGERLAQIERGRQASSARLRRNAPFEVAEECRRVEALSGRAPDRLLGGKTIAELVDILAQPAQQAFEMAAANFFGKRVLALIGFRQLRGIEAAQRIGRKIAEHAEAPMHVLQDAFAIRGGSGSDQSRAALIPYRAQLGNGEVARQKRNLELVPEQD